MLGEANAGLSRSVALEKVCSVWMMVGMDGNRIKRAGTAVYRFWGIGINCQNSNAGVALALGACFGAFWGRGRAPAAAAASGAGRLCGIIWNCVMILAFDQPPPSRTFPDDAIHGFT